MPAQVICNTDDQQFQFHVYELISQSVTMSEDMNQLDGVGEAKYSTAIVEACRHLQCGQSDVPEDWKVGFCAGDQAIDSSIRLLDSVPIVSPSAEEVTGCGGKAGQSTLERKRMVVLI
ncbi:hypothetical protein DOTSEDRAFT_39639 [Dothistroma septosporum NZE10]|uniref:Uncharacterized protein n=1 Tax=Dothistroma septosporum (strain NZE10 / CBS 128990) TaxID=675120 RepID=M2YHU6_DOTSN|nr:hypothetical protein DOTSEDRAFT_39639 [Dothistroma septosporum NZE10]